MSDLVSQDGKLVVDALAKAKLAASVTVPLSGVHKLV